MSSPLDKLRAKAEACDRCDELVAARSRVVFGDGPVAKGGLVVVGDGPGPKEDRRGRCFLGAEGKKARAMMAEAGLDPAAAFWTSVVLCNTGGRAPLPPEVDACKFRLRRTLDILRPRVVLAFGVHAARALCVSAPKTHRTMRKLHGYIYDVGLKVRGNRQVITVVVPTWPPRYLVRDGAARFEADCREDFARAKALLDGAQATGAWFCRELPVDYGKGAR